MGNSNIRKNIIALNDKVAASQGNTPQYLEDITKNIGLTNLLKNGSFESWSQGASAAPDEWTCNVGSVSQESSIVKHQSYSAHLVGTNAQIYQYVTSRAGGLDYIAGRTYTIAVWVYSDTANSAKVILEDGTQSVSFDNGNVVNQWTLIVGRITVVSNPSPSSNLSVILRNVSSSAATYFDGAIFVEGASYKVDYTGSYEPNTFGEGIGAPLIAWNDGQINVLKHVEE